MRYLILAAWVAALAAQTAHESAEDRARTVPGGASRGVLACHQDIERFCAKVKPGEGRLGRCLQARLKELSAPCRKYALHGGRAHVARALNEIDLDVSASTPTVKGSSEPFKTRP